MKRMEDDEITENGRKRGKTMKIRYIGKARIRVEGVGDFEPQEERDVKDAVAGELCRGGEFREAPPSGASRHLPPQAGAGTAADEGETGRKSKNRKNAQSNETAADDAANDQTAADDTATREE